jgi:hypothetical protein
MSDDLFNCDEVSIFTGTELVNKYGGTSEVAADLV